jgi:hypothetical protein
MPDTLPAQLEGAPAEVVSVFLSAQNAPSLFDDDNKSNSPGWHAVKRSGWYIAQDGKWHQLAPNILGKINLTRPVKQPDGNYAIFDVPVFYPNAVKGTDPEQAFDAARIGRIIANTNRHAKDGGPRPGLVLDHPTPEQSALGVFKPAFGTAINFRPSTQFAGKTACDLVDVPEKIVDMWRKGEILGLSVGPVPDAAGLNERIGHIAMLGARSPALAGLNVTELMSVAPKDQLFFAAEPMPAPGNPAIPAPNPHGSSQMDLSKHKAAVGKLQAAFAAFEAGEPGADKKHEEAAKELREAYAATPEHNKCMFAVQTDQPKPAGPTGANQLPTTATLTPGNPAEPGSNPKPQDAGYAAQFSAQEKRIADLEKLNGTLVAERLGLEFNAQLDKLAKDGHQFDADSARTMFATTGGDPVKIKQLMDFLGKTPKAVTGLESIPPHNPGEAGAVFTAPTGETFDVRKERALILQGSGGIGAIDPKISNLIAATEKMSRRSA